VHKKAHDPHRQSGKTAVPPNHYSNHDTGCHPIHPRSRYPIVDAARGAAIVLMFVYHFMFDLRYYNVVAIDFNNDPVWLGLRTLIVGLFLGVMGVSLHLATASGLRNCSRSRSRDAAQGKSVRKSGVYTQYMSILRTLLTPRCALQRDREQFLNQRAFVRRLLQVVGCAALVSISSYMMFPKSMIFFGILHFIAAASVLGLLFYRWFWVNLAMGVALIVVGLTVQHPWFDQPGWQWIGLMTHKPLTEDYVPLLPWFGVVLLGLFVGKWIFSTPPVAGPFTEWAGSLGKSLVQWQGKSRLSRLLIFGGRHSLPIYMLHQPVFFAILYLFLGT